MRVGPRILGALVAIGALAYLLTLLGTPLSPDRLPGVPWIALAGFAFVLTRRAVVHARDDEPRHAPETTLRLCGVGIGAWTLLGFALVAPRVDLPDRAWWAWLLGLLYFACANAFTLSLVTLFAVEFGIVTTRKARSAGAKCVVAVVHFGAPLGYLLLSR